LEHAAKAASKVASKAAHNGRPDGRRSLFRANTNFYSFIMLCESGESLRTISVVQL
jgi:hypothetical protein